MTALDDTTSAGSTWHRACTLDDLWVGEMEEVTVAGHRVLLVHVDDGDVRGFQAICPHQEIRLIEGELTEDKLICRGHLWEFDPATGAGINPGDCRLATYPVEVRGEEVYVSVEGVTPLHSY